MNIGCNIESDEEIEPSDDSSTSTSTALAFKVEVAWMLFFINALSSLPDDIEDAGRLANLAFWEAADEAISKWRGVMSRLSCVGGEFSSSEESMVIISMVGWALAVAITLSPAPCAMVMISTAELWVTNCQKVPLTDY